MMYLIVFIFLCGLGVAGAMNRAEKRRIESWNSLEEYEADKYREITSTLTEIEL